MTQPDPYLDDLAALLLNAVRESALFPTVTPQTLHDPAHPTPVIHQLLLTGDHGESYAILIGRQLPEDHTQTTLGSGDTPFPPLTAEDYQNGETG